MPRPRRKQNREYGMGLLAWYLQDVKPIAPDEIPEERRTFIQCSEYLESLARQVVKERKA